MVDFPEASENPMDRGAWWAAVHGVAKSRKQLRDFPSTFHFHALEKEMATHSSVLAWSIPGTKNTGVGPGDLPNPGIEPQSPALAGRFFTTEPPEKPLPSLISLIKSSLSFKTQISDCLL